MSQLEVPTTTPDQLPTPEQPKGERAFTLIALNNLRRKTQELERHDGETDAEYDARYAQHVDQSADAYMTAAGIDDSLRTVHSARVAEILHTPDHYWYVGPRVYEHDTFGMPVLDSEGKQVYHNDLSGTDKVWNLQAEMYGRTIAETEPTVTDEEAETTVDITERRGLLDDKRTALAKLAAKRQSRVAGKGGEAYATAKDEYTELMREVAKHDLRDQLDDENLTVDQKKVVVVDYLLREQTALREQTVTELRGTRLGKFIGWMAKGGVVKRALKGVAVGLGAGVVGAGIGALAGVAGIATIGAGLAAGATAVGRAVRGYAAHDAHSGRGMDTVVHTSGRDATLAMLDDNDHAEHVDAGITHVDTLFERDTKHEQSKRRESAAAGMAGVVLGTTIAFGLQSAADTGLFHGAWNHVPNGDTHAANGGQTPGGTHDTGTKPPEPANPNVAPNGIVPSDTPGTADALRNSLPGGGAHDILDPLDAFTITPGEGLYETFQEMGIPQPMWHDVMNDVGPQLQQLGDTYWDPTHAEWRISHTGQFSEKAMKIMAAAATKHGYSLAA